MTEQEKKQLARLQRLAMEERVAETAERRRVGLVQEKQKEEDEIEALTHVKDEDLLQWAKDLLLRNDHSSMGSPRWQFFHCYKPYGNVDTPNDGKKHGKICDVGSIR